MFMSTLSLKKWFKSAIILYIVVKQVAIILQICEAYCISKSCRLRFFLSAGWCMCGSWPLEGWGSFGGFVARQNPGQMLRRMYSDRSVGWCCFRLFDFRCIRFGLFWTRFVRFSKFDRFLCSSRLCVSLSSSHPRPYLCSSS